MAIKNYLTIDVEDYFHVSAFEKLSAPETWAGRECRVERNTDLVLSLLADNEVKATFFILGWVAERYPQLAVKIANLGHEVASHGYLHQRVALQDRETYKQDIRRGKGLLEDQIGAAVLGYRAPSYSITRQTSWAFDELLEAGFKYDSSIFPMQHDFYGIPDWPRFSGYAVKNGGKWEDSPALMDGQTGIQEIPITTLQFGDRNLPIAGGGYFRLLPYAITRWGLKQINNKEQEPFVFYLHPWEFDPQQPRMAGASAKSRFRHYLNLGKTESRFKRLISDFSFSSIKHGLSMSD
ncbi:polysaccharide deacetylase family protein, PEP-CTERM locus subfamily [Desulfuromusa kysingii]|uniref:Polysaccharide deacetylase family protein, PEP-CTERM locus subfamily n=1 Tax=Desulfuromusa kysingii TaxID=37625 RepID=A0A1H4B8Y3_9BACT|nr:XrtA system polysaccharide deacetylase [Desulfuromusa kysingii]SEA44685.1 polysaccharide deacetylase family protein, PEP-CTERM locus subfamily [Desulfuromusa kysingii]